MQTNETNLDTSPIKSLVLPDEAEENNVFLNNLKETATTVQIFFEERLSKLSSLLKAVTEKEYQAETLSVEAKVYDPDLMLAKRCSWAVKGYQKVFEKAVVSGSPGPGNGYFETIQLLLEQIDILSIKFGLKKEFDRTQYFTCVERMFPEMPRLTRCNYPAILYFIALRIKDQKKSPDEIRKQLDFWMVSLEPSKNLYTAALILLSHCHNMFNLLRYASEEEFCLCYQEFEKSWKCLYRQFEQEQKEYSFNWCPDICINVIMRDLSKSRKYPPKLTAALRLVKHFDEHSNTILKAIEKYPLRCSDTYINNRAYNIALQVIKLSSTTLDTMSGVFIHEVKILEI